MVSSLGLVVHLTLVLNFDPPSHQVTIVSVGTQRGGKSYSMVGKRGSEGLLQRICAHLFRMIAGEKPKAAEKPLTSSPAGKPRAGKSRRSRSPTSGRRKRGTPASGSRARRGAKRSPASRKKGASLDDLHQRFLDSFGASAGKALFGKVKADPSKCECGHFLPFHYSLSCALSRFNGRPRG